MNACRGHRMAQAIVNGYSRVDVRICSQPRPRSLPVMYVHKESNRWRNKTQHTLNWGEVVLLLKIQCILGFLHVVSRMHNSGMVSSFSRVSIYTKNSEL